MYMSRFALFGWLAGTVWCWPHLSWFTAKLFAAYFYSFYVCVMYERDQIKLKKKKLIKYVDCIYWCITNINCGCYLSVWAKHKCVFWGTKCCNKFHISVCVHECACVNWVERSQSHFVSSSLTNSRAHCCYLYEHVRVPLYVWVCKSGRPPSIFF